MTPNNLLLFKGKQFCCIKLLHGKSNVMTTMNNICKYSDQYPGVLVATLSDNFLKEWASFHTGNQCPHYDFIKNKCILTIYGTQQLIVVQR